MLKCIVIETQNQGLHWRAYPYIEALNPDLESKDSIEMYTNEMTENKSGIEIQKDINFGTMNVDTKKSIFVWIKSVILVLISLSSNRYSTATKANRSTSWSPWTTKRERI